MLRLEGHARGSFGKSYLQQFFTFPFLGERKRKRQRWDEGREERSTL
jgi:hypothetical protein